MTGSAEHMCVMIGRYKISQLLFADDLVLQALSKSGLQHSLNIFAAAHDKAGMKISTSKTEVLHFSRNPVQSSLQVGSVSLKQEKKFKYLGVAFTSDKRQRIGCLIRQSKCCNASFEPFSRLEMGAIEKSKTLDV